jgi:hypothetical protein
MQNRKIIRWNILMSKLNHVMQKTRSNEKKKRQQWIGKKKYRIIHTHLDVVEGLNDNMLWSWRQEFCRSQASGIGVQPKHDANHKKWFCAYVSEDRVQSHLAQLNWPGCLWCSWATHAPENFVCLIRPTSNLMFFASLTTCCGQRECPVTSIFPKSF